MKTAGTIVLAAALAGCRLPAFTEAGEPSNVVVAGAFAYASLAEDGIGVYELREGRLIETVALQGASRVDDLSVADGLLFTLDGKGGRLAAYSLADPRAPRLVGEAREVPVGPFSGVSAAAGRVVVSGGTSEMTLLSYDGTGRLTEVARLDLGRGQPDVLLSPDGELAIVSTHFSFWDETFGVSIVELDTQRTLATVEILGAGYGPGGARPSNFPLQTALSGTTLFVASAAGLTTINIAEPTHPQILSMLALDVSPVGLAARGSLVAVAGNSPRAAVELIDARKPHAPATLTTLVLAADARPTSIAFGEAELVVAAGPARLQRLALP